MADHLKLLEGNAKTIAAASASLTAVERAELLNAELEGKNRATVVAALQPVDVDPVVFIPAGSEGSIEDVMVSADVSTSHVSLDSDVRAGTTDIQNRVDFNDPSRSGVDVVTEQLGMTSESDAE